MVRMSKHLIILYKNLLSGRDAKRIVILKGDFESEVEKGGQMKEDLAKKYSAYFQSILHHNNGYFIQVRTGPSLNPFFGQKFHQWNHQFYLTDR